MSECIECGFINGHSLKHFIEIEADRDRLQKEVEDLKWCARVKSAVTKQYKDSLHKHSENLESELSLLRPIAEAAKMVEKKQPDVLAMLRKHDFVFDGKHGRWEKLAFTLYTDICEIHSHVRELNASYAAFQAEREGK